MLEHFQYRKLDGSAITVFLTETCPCILRYAHKMSHAKPFPVPGSPAGPEPVMPMPMLPTALTMLPMRRQWVKPSDYRRKMGLQLEVNFPKSHFQTIQFHFTPSI